MDGFCLYHSSLTPHLSLSGSWDDSSSVSSGLSDTVDNISTDDLNTPTYPAITSSQRKNKAAQVQYTMECK